MEYLMTQEEYELLQLSRKRLAQVQKQYAELTKQYNDKFMECERALALVKRQEHLIKDFQGSVQTFADQWADCKVEYDYRKDGPDKEEYNVSYYVKGQDAYPTK